MNKEQANEIYEEIKKDPARMFSNLDKIQDVLKYVDDAQFKLEAYRILSKVNKNNFLITGFGKNFKDMRDACRYLSRSVKFKFRSIFV